MSKAINYVYGDDPCGQARHLTDVADEARTIIAATLDVPLARVDTSLIVDDFDSARDIQPRTERIAALRIQVDRLSSELEAEQVALVKELRREDVPDVDVATLLGVARQRVGQLAE